MRLPFFRARNPADEPPKPGRSARGKVAAALASVDEAPLEARTRARRRLIGALVLLVVGVVGFPMLFETQPRPLPMDTPILLPQSAAPRIAAAPVVPSLKPLPAPPPDAGNEAPAPSAAAIDSGPAKAPAKGPDPTVPVAVPAPVSPPVAAKPAVVKPEPVKPEPVKPEPAKAEPAKPDPPKPAPARPEAAKPEPSKADPAKAPPAAAQDPAAAAGGRFVVQVGAFTDADRLRAARQKLEKQGIKTYTQEIQTAAGKSTRVRVGPYATRQEADAVASKIKAGGMQANILAL